MVLVQDKKPQTNSNSNTKSSVSKNAEDSLRRNMGLDPNTVPTVPKLLPPSIRASPPEELSLETRLCLQWENTKVSGPSVPVPKQACIGINKNIKGLNPLKKLFVDYLEGKDNLHRYNSGDKKIDTLGKRYNYTHLYNQISQKSKLLDPLYNFGALYTKSFIDGTQTKYIESFFLNVMNGNTFSMAKRYFSHVFGKWF